MNSFKISKKQTHKDDRMSMLAKHEATIEKFDSEKKNLPTYKKKLNLLLNLKENRIKNKHHNISNLSDEITNLQKKIYIIENDIEFSEYLFKSLEFVNEMVNNEFVETETSNNKPDQDSDIFNYIKLEKEKKNEEIYKRYMSTCFPEESSVARTIIKHRQIFKCIDCEGDTVQDVSSGTLVCYTCGLTEVCNITSQPEWNTVETHEFVKPYSYKRTNHFREWIIQIQGREGTHVPEEVINLLLNEIKKERLTSKNMITYVKIKEFLKKLRLNKYYEHIPNIIHKLTGNTQLIIDSELEKKLLELFNDIQKPFEKYCPKNRKNFLSYSYTLYKFFQLLKKDEYLVYFPLLKSREKLFEQEAIWKNICEDLGWEFIKCI